MGSRNIRWDPDEQAVLLVAAPNGRGVAGGVLWAIRAVLVLLTVVLVVGSVLLGGGFDVRTLLPLVLGWPVTMLLASSAQRTDEGTWVRVAPDGVAWADGATRRGGQVAWADVVELRRTRRYVRVGGSPPTGLGGSTLTHGLSLVTRDDEVHHLPDDESGASYPALVSEAVRRGVVPGDLRLVGLDGTVPADPVPPRAEEQRPATSPHRRGGAR